MTVKYLLVGCRVATRATGTVLDPCLPSTDLVSLSDCLVDLVPSAPGWDDWFADPASADPARLRANRTGQHLLGVGIAEQDVPAFLADLAYDAWDQGGPGERLTRPAPLTGEPLGFELTGFDNGCWPSRLRLGGLADDVREATGVRPGRRGLIQDERQARVAADRLTASGFGDPEGRPMVRGQAGQRPRD